MTATQLLKRWIAAAAFAIASGLWQGKIFDVSLLGIAVLSATALTGLAALKPPTKRPGWSGVGLAWIRNCLIMSIIWGVMIGSSLLHTAIASFIFATMFTIETLMKRNGKA